jgi:ABC-2 type transport system permease protein
MSAAYAQMNGSRVLAAYLGDIRFELVKMIRTPAFAIPTLLFPLIFFLLFGVLMGSARGNAQMSLFAFTSYGVFGAIAPGLFGFGVSLAFEREQGLLLFRQAIPMPAGSYLLARMVMAMIFVAIVTLAMILMAILVAHVPLTIGQCVVVFFVNVLGVLPFCAIGLFVGSMVSGQAAPAIVNLIYIPMSFLSGLWVPMQFLPRVVQEMAPIWPAHHLVQLSLTAVDAPSMGDTATHIGALVGVTILFFALAMRRLGGSGIRLFGAARGGFPLRRAINVGIFWIAVGLVIAGVLGGNAPKPAAAKAAPDSNESKAQDAAATAPAGTPAPDRPLIADFDGGSEKTSYGLGFAASDDEMRGGNSTASQKLVDGGAANSRGALEVTGEVGKAIEYPFAGASFLPNGTPNAAWQDQGWMDYSRKKTLIFHTRGDGQDYMVMVMGPVLDAIPAMYTFTAGAEWQEVRVPLENFASADLKRVKLIAFGTMTPGAFRFQIDDVRVE